MYKYTLYVIYIVIYHTSFFPFTAGSIVATSAMLRKVKDISFCPLK